MRLAQALKERGAFVIGISDSPVAPIAEYTDILLSVCLPVMSTIDTAPAVFSLMNALVAGVAIQDREKFQHRKEKYESFQLEDFFLLKGETRK
ncbi:hypothetical protein L1765_13945 [Microaerobacter geothermalis]|nr:hypothetical protein [Microaerobacter geothermalis]